jgi:hypothetical protein
MGSEQPDITFNGDSEGRYEIHHSIYTLFKVSDSKNYQMMDFG